MKIFIMPAIVVLADADISCVKVASCCFSCVQIHPLDVSVNA